MLKGKHIILGISGGIAAYKSVYLLRLLIKAGADIQDTYFYEFYLDCMVF